MRGYLPILVVAWLLAPYAFVNVGFGLALVLLQLGFWWAGRRRHGALLMTLGRRAGVERVVELGTAAVAVGALIEVAAVALATPVTLWGVRLGVALSVAGLATVATALRPSELREAGVTVRGRLIRWDEIVGHSWHGSAPTILELSCAGPARRPRQVAIEVPDDARADAERLLRQHAVADRPVSLQP